MKILLLIALFLISSRVLLAQRDDVDGIPRTTLVHGDTSDIPIGEFSLRLEQSMADYAGTYCFGTQRAAPLLEIKVKNGRVTATLHHFRFTEKPYVIEYDAFELKLKRARIEGGIFLADGVHGVFVIHDGLPGIVMFTMPDVWGPPPLYAMKE